MSITWTEIRLRAAKFSSDWRGESYEKGEAQSFYNEFFEIFGLKRRTVARFEEHVKRLGQGGGYIDLFWPGVLIAEHKSLGENLAVAEAQALTYFDAIEEGEKPRFRLACDFQRFALTDLDTNTRIEFTLVELEKHVDNFAFMIGKQRPVHTARLPLTEKACGHVAALYAELKRSGYSEEDTEELIARLIFLFFADSSGIFQPRGLFMDFVESRTELTGSDLGPQLAMLFEVLNTSPEARQLTLDKELSEFPYINGSLFLNRLSILAGNSAMRAAIVSAGQFDWSMVSPAIFGTLLDAVITEAERASSGSHATGEEVIQQIANDLFLDELRSELCNTEKAGSDKVRQLERLRSRLREIRVFDPAAGCGNFLAVIYRELRLIELQVLKALTQARAIDPAKESQLSVVNVDQFFGYEPRRTARRVAELALWMTDHLLNRTFELELGVPFARIPLKTKPNISGEDALNVDWNSLLPSHLCTLLVGNPPYLGSKKQSPSQRQLVASMRRPGQGAGTLDLTAAWLLKAGKYCGLETRCAFVTTSSIVQGEQIGQLFPDFLESGGGIEITFGYQPFQWISPTRGGANVEVVVIGFARRWREGRKILRKIDCGSTVKIDYCQHISPYLRSGDKLLQPNSTVVETKQRPDGVKKLRTGSKPIDGGYFVLTSEEKAALLKRHPAASDLIRPFVGGDEYLKGTQRFIIYLGNDSAMKFRELPGIMDLVRKVAAYRAGTLPSKDGRRKRDKDAEEIAGGPTAWHITLVPTSSFLIVPEVTSERREYIPIAWMEPPIIPSNLVKVLFDATLVDFGLLTSSMHMAWVRTVGGRLTGRYRYSIDLIYNNFPRPTMASLNLCARRIGTAANAVLTARKALVGLSLEAMYDPNLMPASLRRAHKQLDAAIDSAYRPQAFHDDQQRFEFLMNMYTR